MKANEEKILNFINSQTSPFTLDEVFEINKIKKNKQLEKNFLSFREIFLKNNDLDNELELFYYSKLYERKKLYTWNKELTLKTNISNKFLEFINWFFLDLSSRYFTNWYNVMLSIFFAILIYATIYCIAPLFYQLGWTSIGYINGISIQISSVSAFFQYIGLNLYFSIITFTTIGYGDLLPAGLLSFIAGIEGFTGILLTSLFLVTLAKRVLG